MNAPAYSSVFTTPNFSTLLHALLHALTGRPERTDLLKDAATHDGTLTLDAAPVRGGSVAPPHGLLYLWLRRTDARKHPAGSRMRRFVSFGRRR